MILPTDVGIPLLPPDLTISPAATYSNPDDPPLESLCDSPCVSTPAHASHQYGTAGLVR